MKGMEDTMRALRSDSVPRPTVQIETDRKAEIGDLCRPRNAAQAELGAPHERRRTLAGSDRAGLPQQFFDSGSWSAAGQKHFGAEPQQLGVPEGLPGLAGIRHPLLDRVESLRQAAGVEAYLRKSCAVPRHGHSPGP